MQLRTYIFAKFDYAWWWADATKVDAGLLAISSATTSVGDRAPATPQTMQKKKGPWRPTIP
jgi:hypothetical protein